MAAQSKERVARWQARSRQQRKRVQKRSCPPTTPHLGDDVAALLVRDAAHKYHQLVLLAHCQVVACLQRQLGGPLNLGHRLNRQARLVGHAVAHVERVEDACDGARPANAAQLPKHTQLLFDLLGVARRHGDDAVPLLLVAQHHHHAAQNVKAAVVLCVRRHLLGVEVEVLVDLVAAGSCGDGELFRLIDGVVGSEGVAWWQQDNRDAVRGLSCDERADRLLCGGGRESLEGLAGRRDGTSCSPLRRSVHCVPRTAPRGAGAPGCTSG